MSQRLGKGKSVYRAANRRNNQDSLQAESNEPFFWSREITIQLISMYEHTPDLYCTKSPNYTNKRFRNAALQVIANKLNETHNANLTKLDINKKIHGLRTSYLQELKKVKRHESAGYTDLEYVPRWWGFSLLHFLYDSMATRQEEMGIEPSDVVKVESDLQAWEIEEPDEQFILSDCEELYVSSPLSRDSGLVTPISPSKRIKVDPGGSGLGSVGSTSNVEQPRHNANEMFVKYLTSEMDTIEDDECLDNLKKEIVEAIFKAKQVQRDKRQL